MSSIIPRCERCNLDRAFVRLAPLANAQTYGVEWRCPHCDDHLLDLCPIGPIVPTAQTCLNCGTPFPETEDAAKCPACGLSRLGARDTFGLDPAPADAVAVAGPLFDLGLSRRALATLNFALIHDPSLEQAWRIKYSFLSGLRFSEAALAVIDAALVHCNDPELHISRGYTLAELGRHHEAIKSYRQFLARGSNSPDAGVALGNLANSFRAVKDDASAEVMYRHAIEKDPSRPSHYANFARLLLDQKRIDEAHPVIDKGWSISREPSDVVRMLQLKALAWAEQQHGEDALKCIDAAMAQGADDLRTHYLRGRALALLGRMSDARAAMQRVLKIDPANVDALRALRLIAEAGR